MNNKQRKEIVYKIYSDNFAHVVKHSNINDIYGYGCLCPICMYHFERSDLTEMTIEHNPPKSLGGKGNILTCRKCNSLAGHEIDNEILKHLLQTDGFAFKPNSKLNTKLFTKNNKDGINALFTIDEKLNFILNVNRKTNSPINYEKFLQSQIYQCKSPFFCTDFEDVGWTRKINFTIKKPTELNQKKLKVALLKIAYLKAFEKFGHLFIINEKLDSVRLQIANPNQEIIKPPIHLNFDFPDQLLGVNIVTEPQELKCVLVIFDLTTKSDKYRFSICLPGFGQKNGNIYENIKTILCSGEGNQQISINNYFNLKYDIKNLERTFDIINFWNALE